MAYTGCARRFFVTDVLLDCALSYKNNRPRQRRSLGPIMRTAILLLGCLATCISLPAVASGQNQLGDPKQAIEQAFWKDLYGAGGTSLYCGQTFTTPGSTCLLYTSRCV